MTETPPGNLSAPEEDLLKATLGTEAIEGQESFQEQTGATEAKGKGKGNDQKQRSNHRMLPPEILETYAIQGPFPHLCIANSATCIASYISRTQRASHPLSLSTMPGEPLPKRPISTRTIYQDAPPFLSTTMSLTPVHLPMKVCRD